MCANADEPDERRLRVDGPVQGLGHVVTHGRQPLDPTLGQTPYPIFSCRFGMTVDRLVLPVRSPRPLSVPCTCPSSGLDRSDRVGDRTPGVVVAVDADDRIVADVRLHVGDDLSDLVRQRAAVRVAQDEVRRAVDDGRLDRPQRELGVLAIAIEEVLEVDQHLPARTVQEGDRIGDHRRPLVECGLERFDDLVLRALRHDADGRGVRLDQIAQRRIVVALAARAARRAECDERRRRQIEFVASPSEELDVLRVRPGPAAFDEVHAEQVELVGDTELVVDRRRDALDLEAVAECGVEDFDESHVVGSCRSAVRRWSSAPPSEVRATVDFNAAAGPDVLTASNCSRARCGPPCGSAVHIRTESVDDQWMNQIDLGVTKKVLWVTM